MFRLMTQIKTKETRFYFNRSFFLFNNLKIKMKPYASAVKLIHFCYFYRSVSKGLVKPIEIRPYDESCSK